MKTEAAICMATLSNDSNTVVNIVKGVLVNISEEATLLNKQLYLPDLCFSKPSLAVFFNYEGKLKQKLTSLY